MSVRSLPIKACLRLYFHIQHIRQRTFHKPKPAKIRTKKQKTNAPREETAQQQEIAAVSRARLINVFLVTFFSLPMPNKRFTNHLFLFPPDALPKGPPILGLAPRPNTSIHPSLSPPPISSSTYSLSILTSSSLPRLISLSPPSFFLTPSSLLPPFLLYLLSSSLLHPHSFPLFRHFFIFVPSSLSFFLIITITFRPSFSLRS